MMMQCNGNSTHGLRMAPDPKVVGKRDSIHHHLLKVTLETATVPELRQKLLYTTPSGWWWYTDSVFRVVQLPFRPMRCSHVSRGRVYRQIDR